MAKKFDNVSIEEKNMLLMKIANAYGGLDMADADVLRRMMSGKYRSKDHLIEIEDKFFSNCKAKG
ncbi:hypothetical protein, partial [Sphingobacterium siyangense]|uniref:hypothetical protein n=1 Tax=Sphingobacterium siyangense TaxID=459529 RepID=UPI002FDEEFCF